MKFRNLVLPLLNTFYCAENKSYSRNFTSTLVLLTPYFTSTNLLHKHERKHYIDCHDSYLSSTIVQKSGDKGANGCDDTDSFALTSKEVEKFSSLNYS